MSILSYIQGMKMTVTLPVGGTLAILSIICLWAIFEKRGEDGWKAIIPFYRDYIFGKVAKQPKVGKRLMFAKLFSVFAVIAELISVINVFVGGTKYWDEYTGRMSYQPNYPAWAIISSIVLGIAIFVICILILIWQIKLYYRFTVINRAPGWLVLIFIFLNPLALVYFAFVRGTDIDPFPPMRHNDI